MDWSHATQEPEQEAKNARHSNFVSWSLKSCRDCAKTSHISTCTNKNGQNSIPEAGYKRAGQTRRSDEQQACVEGQRKFRARARLTIRAGNLRIFCNGHHVAKNIWDNSCHQCLLQIGLHGCALHTRVLIIFRSPLRGPSSTCTNRIFRRLWLDCVLLMQPRAFISIWSTLIQPASWSSQGKPRDMGTRSLNFFGV